MDGGSGCCRRCGRAVDTVGARAFKVLEPLSVVQNRKPLAHSFPYYTFGHKETPNTLLHHLQRIYQSCRQTRKRELLQLESTDNFFYNFKRLLYISSCFPKGTLKTILKDPWVNSDVKLCNLQYLDHLLRIIVIVYSIHSHYTTGVHSKCDIIHVSARLLKISQLL